MSGGDATLTGTLNIGDSGKINFRDTDISIGSTLTDGILDITADFSIDMFFDNADVGDEADGQSLNINRRAVEGDDYISLYVDKNRKGLIGFSGDNDLLQLAANALTVNGSLTAIGTVTLSTSNEINFRDTDISMGSTLADGILDISADTSIRMFYDNADVGDETDGQKLLVYRRAVEGDSYLEIYQDKDKSGILNNSAGDILISAIGDGHIQITPTQTLFYSVIKIQERAAAVSDTGGFGQLWVKNTTPCELWFTDDQGLDTQIV